jgi:tetratricopeptide (TPR) repeat protein
MIGDSFQILRQRWADLPLFVRLVLLAAVVLLGLVAALPVYQGLKGWRVDRNLAAARKAVADDRMVEARDLSQSVLLAGERGIEAYRILAKATAALHDRRHGTIARVVLSHPESSDEDRLESCRSLVPTEALGVIGQIWTSLSAKDQQDPRFAVLIADRLIAAGSLSEAGKVLLTVPEALHPGKVERGLVRILIGFGHRGKGYGEAQRCIANSLPADGTDLIEWLELLEEIPIRNLRPEALEPVRKVLAQPPSGSEARAALMLARIDYAANGPGGAAIVDAAVGRWRDREPELVADFLSALGLDARLLEVFPPASVESHPGMFSRILKAVERQGAWERATPLLDAFGHRLPKFEELAHRTLALTRQGDPAAASEAWKAAMEDAKTSPLPASYLTLHRVASEGGLTNEAEQAMVAAIRQASGPLPLFATLEPLLASLEQQGRDDTLHEICARYLALEPNNPALLGRFLYLSCVRSSVEPSILHESAQALATAYPDDLAVQCVLATTLLCAGQADAADAVFRNLRLDPDSLVTGYRAAYLTTQVLARHLSPDDPLVAAFPWPSLLPSERQKYKELMRNARP